MKVGKSVLRASSGIKIRTDANNIILCKKLTPKVRQNNYLHTRRKSSLAVTVDQELDSVAMEEVVAARLSWVSQ